MRIKNFGILLGNICFSEKTAGNLNCHQIGFGERECGGKEVIMRKRNASKKLKVAKNNY